MEHCKQEGKIASLDANQVWIMQELKEIKTNMKEGFAWVI